MSGFRGTFSHPHVLGRCVVAGCPFRWRDGVDRPCWEHADAHAQPATVVTLLPPPTSAPGAEAST